MSNKLNVPDHLLHLIEKRDLETRRQGERRGDGSADAAAGAEEERRQQERRQGVRREDDAL